jgi:hypothetical protein
MTSFILRLFHHILRLSARPDFTNRSACSSIDDVACQLQADAVAIQAQCIVSAARQATLPVVGTRQESVHHDSCTTAAAAFRQALLHERC